MYLGNSNICLLHRQTLFPIAVQRIYIFPSFKAKLWDCSVLENNALLMNPLSKAAISKKESTHPPDKYVNGTANM